MADVDNITNVSIVGDSNGSNLTGRDAATMEGIALTYTGLLLMALAPIFFGSARSVLYHSGLKVHNFKRSYGMAGEVFKCQTTFPVLEGYCSTLTFSILLIISSSGWERQQATELI